MRKLTRRITRKKTAGEEQNAALKFSYQVDPMEVADARMQAVMPELQKCAEIHDKIFDEDEYFICIFTAGDPLLKTLIRHKYAAFLFLPSPRPQQVCFLYNKHTQQFKRLWALPTAAVMATISETGRVHKKWQSTKRWSDSFFNKTFWEDIRKEHGITHLSEHEYLSLYHDELVQALGDQVEGDTSQPFDFSKIVGGQFEKPVDTVSDKLVLDTSGKAEHLNGQVCT